MKIGIVFDDSLDRTDGVQQYVKTIGRWLMKNGHTVHYLVGESDPKLNPDLTIFSLTKNISVKGNQNTLSIPRPADKNNIADILSRERYDILHVQMPFNWLLSGRVIKNAPKSTRIVGTFHIVGASWVENFGSKLLSTSQYRTLRRFDSIASVSSAAQAFARKYFSVESVIIPNAVELNKFRDGKKLTRFDDDKKNILFLNRLVKRKGCEYLIEAAHWLDNRDRFRNRRLVICGKGPLRQELEATTRDYGLGDRISFEGFIDENDKVDYLATADVAVYPSTGGESFGIVLIEAMSAGTLVIGGDNPGYRTVLGGQPSLLVDPNDTREFATRIDNLLNDKELVEELVSWQSEEVKKYDIENVGPQIFDLYEGLH